MDTVGKHPPEHDGGHGEAGDLAEKVNNLLQDRGHMLVNKVDHHVVFMVFRIAEGKKYDDDQA